MYILKFVSFFFSCVVWSLGQIMTDRVDSNMTLESSLNTFCLSGFFFLRQRFVVSWKFLLHPYSCLNAACQRNPPPNTIDRFLTRWWTVPDQRRVSADPEVDYHFFLQLLNINVCLAAVLSGHRNSWTSFRPQVPPFGHLAPLKRTNQF